MTDELLKALKVIKAECEKHENDCNECPMVSRGKNCGVRNEYPENWSLQKREVYF